MQVTLLLAVVTACGSRGTSLSKVDADESIPQVTPPAENGPKLGAIANATPVLERPTANARWLGALHAGALVARSGTALRKSKDCDSGYYPVFPRGVVCLNQGATLDLAHPTLSAMAIQPTLDQSLPYTYARVRKDSALYERDPGRGDGVREAQKLPRGSLMAVVGSWSARIGDGDAERFGLLTNGRFVRASELEAAHGSNFSGYSIDAEHELPVAFVVKRGVSNFKPDGDHFSKNEPLEFHQTLSLSGRFRSVSGTKLWSIDDKHWVREQDVTIVHKRSRFPDFVRDGQRWFDVGVILGTLVAYEGKKPIFATLVSTGRDRVNENAGDTPAITKLGTFEVVNKHVTMLSAPPERAGENYQVYDLPWVIELSSGQALYGAYWHDRFGIERGPGDVALSPSDARRVFDFATPELPKGWHAAAAGAEKTLVVIHK
ncbi:MAG: L,D-transpeptidase [Polyangiaceae bacterium]